MPVIGRYTPQLVREMASPMSTGEVQEMTDAQVVLSSDLRVDGNALYLKGKRVPYSKKLIVLLQFPDQDIGHFVCLWRRKGWHYFDPVGYKMGHYNALKPLQTVDSNPIKFQADYVLTPSGGGVRVQDMNTCGRHCVVRMRYPDLTDQQYAAVLQAKAPALPYDKIVTTIT